jgi:hypothetical protein
LKLAIDGSAAVRTRTPDNSADAALPTPVSDMGPLFSVKLDFVDELDAACPVSARLHDQFQEHKEALASQSRIEVEQAGAKWTIVSADSKYLIQKENQTLNVYDLRKVGEWPKLTGFLIRSPVVAGWQGLEMRAWADSGENASDALAPLRLDRLAPDIMLCIFNGKVDRIEVKQPPEGMHFGASVDGDGFARFHLRRLDTSGPGDQLDLSTKTSVPLRQGNVKRVINVFQLSTDLKTALDKKAARDGATEFTSADFGVEMVESPGRVIFDVGNPTNGDAP